MAKNEYDLEEMIESEVTAAILHLKLNDDEVDLFRRCLREYYLGEANPYLKFKPSRGFIRKGGSPLAKVVNNFSPDNTVLLIALYQIYHRKFSGYIDYFLPDSLHKFVYPDSEEEIDTAPAYVDIAEEKSTDSKDKLYGEHLSDFCKKNKRLLSFIDNATKIEIEQKEGIITKFKVSTEYLGSSLANDIQLEIINDLRDNGNAVLSQIKKAGIILDSKEDFKNLRDAIHGEMFFPNNDERFVFGRDRNSFKKQFIQSLFPLFKYLQTRIKVQSSPKFDAYTNRDYYKFILDFLEIPIDFISVDDMELHLKTPDKFLEKHPDAELPF